MGLAFLPLIGTFEEIGEARQLSGRPASNPLDIELHSDVEDRSIDAMSGLHDTRQFRKALSRTREFNTPRRGR